MENAVRIGFNGDVQIVPHNGERPEKKGVHSDHAQGRLNVHPNCGKPIKPVGFKIVCLNKLY